MKYKKLLDEMTLQRRFERWMIDVNYRGEFDQFKLHLRTLVTDPDEVDRRVQACRTACMNIYDVETMHEYEGGWVCDNCWKQYYKACFHCKKRGRSNAVGRRQVCSTCLAERYTLCRKCSIQYTPDQVNAHRHGAGDCCASPCLEFTFPYDGGHLPQDARVAVDMDDGQITVVGIREVEKYLMTEARNLGAIDQPGSRGNKMYYLAGAVRRTITRDRTNKEGNYATRVKRMAYKEYSLKLEPEILTNIGNIVTKHARAQNVNVAVTRDVNMPSGEFGNVGSCWWTDYKESRCALKSNGGLGLRAFSDAGVVSGRVWVMPMKVGVDGRLYPTFDCDSGIYFVFNGYGSLVDTMGPRVVQKMTGAETYMNVTATVDRYYINKGSGYLVGPQQAIETASRAGLRFTLAAHSNLFTEETGNPSTPKATATRRRTSVA